MWIENTQHCASVGLVGRSKSTAMLVRQQICGFECYMKSETSRSLYFLSKYKQNETFLNCSVFCALDDDSIVSTLVMFEPQKPFVE